ncbi:MAG: polysaccharide deacetylase family protein [Candidatus Bathyarchaeota archaeon]|nr:polysaccharide deacetylase family protein [Candidatus Bathyarchaeota archaeon]MDH5495673.1 polysaccharide deacetylase family protein [Candidatus Bathyarchaeota archaeon]
MRIPFFLFKRRTLRFWDYWLLSKFSGKVLNIPRCGRIKKTVVLSFDVETWDGKCGGQEELSANPEEEYFQYLPRLLAILDKYSVKAQFFVCGKVLELYSEAFEEVARRGHGIGGHGYYHENMSMLSCDSQKTVVSMVKRLMHKKLGVEMRSWRCPGLKANIETFKVLERLGVRYSSNCYRVKPLSINGVLEIPLSARMDYHVLKSQGQKNTDGNLWAEYVKKKIITSSGLLVFGMHTWVQKKYDPECNGVESLLDFLSSAWSSVWIGRFDDFEEIVV